jgi:L-alanine-DL-glutamate epimerase-like enolase superfamily enzyme
VRIEVRSVGSLELFSSEGPVGLGFFCSIFAPLPPLAELERTFAFEHAQTLVGDHPFARANRLSRPRGGNIRASLFDEAIDLALWDLEGKLLGLPVYRLLGGTESRVPAYASGLDYHLSTEESCAFFGDAARRGFRAFKVKVGFRDVDFELERLAAILRAVGPGATLMVDANEAWSPKEAIRRARIYLEHGLDIYWLEDPCLRFDVDGLGLVARETPWTRVNAGEYLDVQGRLRLLERHAVDVLNVHSDVTSSRDSARLAALYGVPVSMGNSLGDVGVHVAASLPELTWMEYSFLGFENLLAEPVEVHEGYAIAPDGPGHGLELSQWALTEYLDAG